MIEREERQQRLQNMDPNSHQRQLQQLTQQIIASDKAHNALTAEFFDKVPYLEAVYMVCYASVVYVLRKQPCLPHAVLILAPVHSP